jgi:mRNA-degrading endonuclease toxin of MazEF toxin-antitoxin module
MPGDSPLRGDIYHIEFDAPVGPHYAVVVTGDAINRNANAVVLAVITTKNMDSIYPHEFRVPTGRLPKPSKVKCHSLVTWPKEELNQKTYVATISKKEMQGLDVALLKALDLWI